MTGDGLPKWRVKNTYQGNLNKGKNITPGELTGTQGIIK